MFLLRTQKLKISFFFFNDTATTEIYTLSLHDALPICPWTDDAFLNADWSIPSSEISGIAENDVSGKVNFTWIDVARSEEHTSELQSQSNLVCRLLLEKKKKNTTAHQTEQDISTINCLR